MTSTRRKSTVWSRGLPASWIVGLGMVAAAVSLVLLFVPLFDAPESAATLVRHHVEQRLNGHGPGILYLWLHYGYIPTIVLLWLLVFAALPWRAAIVWQREHPDAEQDRATQGPRSAPRQPRSMLVFADDGAIEDSTFPESGRIFRSVQELRSMARDARIPWRVEYETEGGARAFLEVLRVDSEDGAESMRAGDRRPTAGSARSDLSKDAAPLPETSAVPETPAVPDAMAAPEPSGLQSWPSFGSRGADPVAAEAARPVGSFLPTDNSASDGIPSDGAASDDSVSDGSAGVYSFSSTSWTPSFSGSVYTSTDVYHSERLVGPEDATGAEDYRSVGPGAENSESDDAGEGTR